ncbi:Pro-Pol poly [Paramuricea clavata]|uniref:Pro-Pol poly n=1 Tax=Paramuricea clavata TaxID=317549 RepID=A0A6S7FMP1_PARCT|nr:Pro-Pol poly [Paramuricea clavata]
MPAYVHSDRGAAFMTLKLRAFFAEKGIATSRTTSYNPEGNDQVEKYNGVVWQTTIKSLRSKNLPTKHWQLVLPDVLHSICSLLCTATNETPHKLFFSFPRRSSTGSSIPTWLATPGTVFLKRHVRASKTCPLVDEVELLQANPQYAYIRYPDGRETTVATRHLDPRGQQEIVLSEPAQLPIWTPTSTSEIAPVSPEAVPVSTEGSSCAESAPISTVEEHPPLRRSERGSWEKAIKNRLKYIRKYDAKKRKLLELGSAGADKPVKETITQVVVKTTRRMDFWNEIPTSTENERIISDHVEELQKECSCPLGNQDVVKVKNIMVTTYEYRRTQVLTKPVPVKELVNKFPPQLLVGVENGTEKVMVQYFEGLNALVWKDFVIFFKIVLCRSGEHICYDCTSGSTKDEKKTASALIEILGEDDDISDHIRNAAHPMLIGVGKNPLKLDCLFICVEGDKLVDVSIYSSDTVLLCFYAVYIMYFQLRTPLITKIFFILSIQ